MKYRTLHNVKSDGGNYATGAEIELTDAEAKPLLERGAIEPIVKPFSKEFKKTALHSNSQEP